MVIKKNVIFFFSSLFSDWPVCGFLCAALHSAKVQLGWKMYLFCSILLCVLACNFAPFGDWSP